MPVTTTPRHVRRRVAVVVVLAVLAALAPAGTVSTAEASGAGTPDGTAQNRPPEPEKIDPELVEDMQDVRPRSGQHRVEAVVVLRSRPAVSTLEQAPEQVATALEQTATSSQEPVVTAIEDRGGQVLNTFWLKNMVLARMTPATVTSLTALDTVERILPNFELEVPPTPNTASDATASEGDETWGIEKIGADVVHDEYGATGDGVRVAVLDTGVDIDHPDLEGKMVTADPSDASHPGGWMEFSSTGEPVASEPRDTNYHGTHVAGTVLGGDASGTQIGVAPGAELMAGLVLPGGNGTFAQVIAGMQWAVAPFDAEGEPAGEPADIVNMSLGVVGQFGALIEPTRNMYLAGVFPSFAIGNNCGGGSGGPGNVYEATAVGATDRSDGIADFSCGETLLKSDWADPPAQWPDSYVVPDVSAPGVEVYSALPDGEYGLLDGTSMATPHVSGTVALMLESRPDLGVDETLQTLVDTSTFDDRYGDQRPNPRYGWGRIDAHRAFSAVSFDSAIVGTITDADTGEEISGATVTRVDVGRDVQADEDGTYEMAVPAGTYDVEISHFGYRTLTVEGIDVRAGELAEVDRELTPLPSGKVSGRVTYPSTGSRVPGAKVEVLGVDGERSATTSVNGSYTIGRLPDGTYEVAASAPGLPSTEVTTVTVSAGRTTKRTDFALPRPVPTQRVSVAANGVDTDGESLVPSLSADGRFVAYYSFASNVVPDDTNGQGDVFVLDRRTGGTERVSVGPGGVEGNGGSVRPSLSADGRYVAFYSFASNLVPGDSNGQGDVFVHDRETGRTERVSIDSEGGQSNGGSFVPAISADGGSVAFYSYASNLVADDTNGQSDVFVHDRDTGSTKRVSVGPDAAQSNGASFVPSLSADGRHVIFESFASNLVPDDTNGEGDVFVHDRQTATTERVSVADDGAEGDNTSQGGSLSADGRYAAFYSSASTLVEGDTNDLDDVFVRDRKTGTTERVSIKGEGVQGNGSSQGIPKVALSAKGRFVAYHSTASNLVVGDTNGRADAFLHDRRDGTTQRVSLAADGSQGDRPSQAPTLNADGQVIAFHSSAATLAVGDTNRETDLFVHDRRPKGPQPQFALADMEIRPRAVAAGRPVRAMARVKNIGGRAGRYDAVLRVDGEIEDRKPVTLKRDEQSRVRFTVRLDDTGTHELSIGPLTERLTVR